VILEAKSNANKTKRSDEKETNNANCLHIQGPLYEKGLEIKTRSRKLYLSTSISLCFCLSETKQNQKNKPFTNRYLCKSGGGKNKKKKKKKTKKKKKKKKKKSTFPM
jgi:hypothetical protein